jgi:hypothetical protein
MTEGSDDGTLLISKFAEILRFFGPFRFLTFFSPIFFTNVCNSDKFLSNIVSVLGAHYFFGRQSEGESNTLLERYPNTYLGLQLR